MQERHRRGNVRGEGNGQAHQAAEGREDPRAPSQPGNHQGDGQDVGKKRQAGGNPDAHGSLEQGVDKGEISSSRRKPRAVIKEPFR